MRAILPLLVLALLGAACDVAGAPEVETTPDTTGVRLERLNDAVEAVATEQREADPLLAEALTVVRRMDEIVAALRDPDTVDDAKDRWEPIEGLIGEVDLEAARTQFREVAFAVDDARARISRASPGATGDWERRYLEAQEEVLTTVRRHARAADALAQVVEHHWDTYTRLRDATGTFVEQRWFYRTPEEAASAYEVEIGDLLDDLRLAQRQIAEFRDRRDEAASAVNDATTDAAAVWAERPPD